MPTTTKAQPASGRERRREPYAKTWCGPMKIRGSAGVTVAGARRPPPTRTRRRGRQRPSPAAATPMKARAPTASVHDRRRTFSRTRRRGWPTPRADGPGGGEGRGVEVAVPQHLFGRHPLGRGLGQIGLEVGRHLVGEGLGDTESLPLLAAVVDELAHESTSAFASPRTASTASRVFSHSATPRSGPFGPGARAGSTSAAGRRCWRRGGCPPARRARADPTVDRSIPHRRWRAHAPPAAWSSRSRRRGPRPSPPTGTGPARLGGAGCGDLRSLPCETW